MMWGKQAEIVPTSKKDYDLPPVALAAVGKAAAEDADEAITGHENGTAVLANGIRSLYEKGEFCDLALHINDQKFHAHRSMLAAMSKNFRGYLKMEVGSVDPIGGILSPIDVAASPVPSPAPLADKAAEVPATTPEAPQATTPATASTEVAERETGEAVKTPELTPAEKAAGKLELKVNTIQTAEAVKLMLDYVYQIGTGATHWEYTPSSADVNKDVLRLARNFGFSHLHEWAARWLTKGLTTANVVERLVTCEEFDLGLLREKILQQLTLNPAELTVVSSSLEIMKHPRILQDLLLAVASLAGAPARAQAGKPEEKSDKKKKQHVEEPAEEPGKKKEDEVTEKQPDPTEEPVKKAAEKTIEKKADKDKVKQEKVEPVVQEAAPAPAKQEKTLQDKTGKRKGEVAAAEPVAPVGKKQKKGSAA